MKKIRKYKGRPNGLDMTKELMTVTSKYSMKLVERTSWMKKYYCKQTNSYYIIL